MNWTRMWDLRLCCCCQCWYHRWSVTVVTVAVTRQSNKLVECVRIANSLPQHKTLHMAHIFSSILAISAVSVANVEWSIYDYNLISTNVTLNLKVSKDKTLEVPVLLSDYTGIWCPASHVLYINHLQVCRVCREYPHSWPPCYLSPSVDCTQCTCLSPSLLSAITNVWLL